jgi:hypothetical protein
MVAQNKIIPIKYQIIVFSLMCAITKKVCRYEAGRDDQGLNISAFGYGVGNKPYKVDLASLACVDMASGTQRSKGRAWVMHMDDVIDTVLSTFEIISPAVTIRDGVMDGDRVITRTF